MYTLMNKNTPLVDFEWVGDEQIGLVPKIVKVYQMPWFISDFSQWLKNRNPSQHKKHIKQILTLCKLQGTKAILDFTKGLSLTDTLWINKEDKYIWEKINLYDNEFSEVISRIAFDTGLYGKQLGTTITEISIDGSFPKCWHRERNGKIYLYKEGSEGAINSGMEPFSELYASQILDQLGYNHASYNITKFKGKIVSRCEIFTSKDRMHLPISIFGDRDYYQLVELCKSKGILKELAENFITDAIILNEDRHLGNLGILCNTDTFEIVGMSPIYDNNLSLLCYYYDGISEAKNMQEYSRQRQPKLYESFLRGALNVASDAQIKKLKSLYNFHFEYQGEYGMFSKKRLKELEGVIQNQVKLLTEGGTTSEFSKMGDEIKNE